jgi:hypothetical protein
VLEQPGRSLKGIFRSGEIINNNIYARRVNAALGTTPSKARLAIVSLVGTIGVVMLLGTIGAVMLLGTIGAGMLLGTIGEVTLLGTIGAVMLLGTSRFSRGTA